ncbi:MAG TPA: ATP synthase F1 subunit gamma [Candidatus Cloacimonetes bacterium]|nr:ATP synthase F1 subunit gamma [Candidatus Cloacimonadota bacterium]
MASLKELKERIESVISTRQVTSAMKMVSAAKLQKAQQRILRARPYSDELNSFLCSLATRNMRQLHPLLAEVDKDAVKNIGLIIVTADKGLCGAFNMNIIRKAEDYLEHHHNKNIELICVGKKCKNYFEHTKEHIEATYIDLFNKLEFHHSRDIMELVTDKFAERKYDKVLIVYNEFKSVIQQNIVLKQLLPIVGLEIKEDDILAPYLFEPAPEKLLDDLIKNHLDVQIWRVLLESSCAEQGARMAAMDAATDSADEMIKELTLEYHHMRQSKITTEIIEVCSGAEGLQ